jgi:hypothetical protein
MTMAAGRAPVPNRLSAAERMTAALPEMPASIRTQPRSPAPDGPTSTTLTMARRW